MKMEEKRKGTEKSRKGKKERERKKEPLRKKERRNELKYQTGEVRNGGRRKLSIRIQKEEKSVSTEEELNRRNSIEKETAQVSGSKSRRSC